MLTWLCIALAAAAPFQLPPGEDPALWIGPAELRGFELEPVQGTGASVEVRGASWVLVVQDTAGGVHRVPVTPPQTEAQREDLLALAASLLKPPALAFELAPPPVDPAPDPPEPVRPRDPPPRPDPPPDAATSARTLRQTHRPTPAGPLTAANDQATVSDRAPLQDHATLGIAVHVGGASLWRPTQSNAGALDLGLWAGPQRVQLGAALAVALPSDLQAFSGSQVQQWSPSGAVRVVGRRGATAELHVGAARRSFVVQGEVWTQHWVPTATLGAGWRWTLGPIALEPHVAVVADLTRTDLSQAGEPLGTLVPIQGTAGLRVHVGDPFGRPRAP
jgi:hypothetical protein